MPSASSNVKVEKQQSSNANAAEIVDNNKVGLDGNSAIGQVYNSIAHKIRNLEKRKVSKPNEIILSVFFQLLLRLLHRM